MAKKKEAAIAEGAVAGDRSGSSILLMSGLNISFSIVPSRTDCHQYAAASWPSCQEPARLSKLS